MPEGICFKFQRVSEAGVGADASVRPMSSREFLQYSVGADALIGPPGSYEFAADFRINGAICRVDVGIDPYRQVGKCIRIRPGFPKKALHPAGGQGRPPLLRHRREIFVQGKAGAGVHTVRQVRPTRPCSERSGGVFQGFICPAGRRCRAARDPRGIRAMRRRRWRCG